MCTETFDRSSLLPSFPVLSVSPFVIVHFSTSYRIMIFHAPLISITTLTPFHPKPPFAAPLPPIHTSCSLPPTPVYTALPLAQQFISTNRARQTRGIIRGRDKPLS